MGAIVSGVASLFGGKKRRKEQKAANKEFEANKKKVQNFKFQNALEGMSAHTAQAGQLGPAAQASAGGYAAQNAEVGQLGDAAQMQSQGYKAEQAELERAALVDLGEDTGFKNQAETLAVNTAAAEAEAAEADQALAASQDAAAQAGTGGGGATALAAAALKSKQGVANSLKQQEAENAKLRVQGATRNQEAALEQRNKSRQNEQQNNQFNAGQANQMAQANMQAQNQAAQFTAGAANAANQANMQAQNQFSQAQFAAGNQFALANQSAQNQAAQFGASAQNAANLANTASQNQFSQAQFNADNQFARDNANAKNQFQMQKAAYDMQNQQSRYGQAQDALGLAGQRKSAADAARQQAKADLVGGISAGADLLLSDERLKENIEKVGVSPSGLNIYHYNYIEEPDVRLQGVMAQEVPEEAQVDIGGWLGVDYSKIDVEFKVIK